MARVQARSLTDPAEVALIALNKPYGVLCQFTDRSGDRDGQPRITLARYVDRAGVYPAGRLDADSEGLLLLTDDGAMASRITHPRHAWAKTYLAQVEGSPGDDELAPLRQGITLKDGPTRPAPARLVAEPDWLWPRDPPIRQRAHIPTRWIELILREGRNRQVRRMTAAIGFPTLRLIRIAIGPHRLEALQPGEWRLL